MEALLTFISTPLYLVLISLELYIAHSKNLSLYDKTESRNSIALGIMGLGLDLLMKGVCFSVLNGVKNSFGIISWENPVALWVGVFLAQDFCFYWLHRCEHSVKVFWAVHVNHHSSEKYNFTVALRSSVFQPLYRYFFFIPCAVLGFSGEQIMFIYAVNQVYQFLLHTETVGKLHPAYEWLMVTPSHHRVHHASNEQYLDKNMGQVLIIWDRMFGTFAPEVGRPIYGITKPLEKQNLVYVWLHEWMNIFRNLRKPGMPLKAKFRYLFSRPGDELD